MEGHDLNWRWGWSVFFHFNDKFMHIDIYIYLDQMKIFHSAIIYICVRLWMAQVSLFWNCLRNVFVKIMKLRKLSFSNKKIQSLQQKASIDMKQVSLFTFLGVFAMAIDFRHPWWRANGQVYNHEEYFHHAERIHLNEMMAIFRYLCLSVFILPLRIESNLHKKTKPICF